MSADEEQLKSDLKDRALEELGETAEIRGHALKVLRQMINDEPGFEPLLDSLFLLQFLRAKKFEAQRALKALKNFYYFRAKYSGSITDVTPRDCRKVLELNTLYFLPRKPPASTAICVLNIGSLDLGSTSAEDIFSTLICALDALVDADIQVCGITIVADYKGLGLRHFQELLRPSFVMLCIRATQDACPLRIKGIHAVNEPSYASHTYNYAVKYLLNKKLKKRIHLHGSNLDSLHRFIPTECLPESLGGKVGEENLKEFKEIVYSRQAYSEKLRHYTFNGIRYPSST